MKSSIPSAVAVALASLTVAAGVAWAGGQGSAHVAGLPVLAWCALLSFAVNWVAFVPAWAARTERYYDLVGSLTYLGTLVCTVVLVKPDPRGALLAGLAAIWASRLGTFLFRRIHRAGSDRRFDEVKQDFGQFFIAWTLQALWVFLTLACALTAMTSTAPAPLGAWAAIGIAIWLFGFTVEIVADSQKSAFRRDPQNADRFIDTGLWSWSRHPNYFGEFVLWTGVAVIAWPVLSGWAHVTLVSPLFVFLLLTRMSGVPPLERRAEEKWGDDPRFRAYVERTPRFWLRPPSRG